MVLRSMPIPITSLAHSATTGQTVDDHHDQTHTVVTHDTTGTGAELNTLTGGGETALHSHGRAGVVWAQPHAVDGTATLSVELVNSLGWAGASLGSSSANGGAFMTIPIPADYTTIVKLVVQVWVDTAGTNNMLYQVLGTAAANGQNRNQHEDSISETTVSLEQHIMREIDISAAATAIVAGDYLGVGFQHNGASGGDAVDAVYILGVLLEYT